MKKKKDKKFLGGPWGSLWGPSGDRGRYISDLSVAKCLVPVLKSLLISLLIITRFNLTPGIRLTPGISDSV